MAVTVLLKLAGFTTELRYVDIARQALAQMESMMAQYPLGFGQWLQALAYALSKPREIAIVGDLEATDTQALLKVVREGYRPLQVIVMGAPDGLQLALTRQLPSNAADGVGSIAAVPLLHDRGLVSGHATTYVCDAPVPGRAFACQAPVTEPEALQAALEQT
jgi:uncharacterized protein YyaL (SSP411 family)